MGIGEGTRARVVLTDAYRPAFSSLGYFAVHIAPCLLFQVVQSPPARLILNGCVKSLSLVAVLKGPEPPTAFRLRDGYLMKFLTFDRY